MLSVGRHICLKHIESKYMHLFVISSDSSADDGDLQLVQESQHLPLEEAFGDEVSGDAVPAPAPLPQRAPAPVVEPNTDHMSAVEELVEALARPFTVSISSFNNEDHTHMQVAHLFLLILRFISSQI